MRAVPCLIAIAMIAASAPLQAQHHAMPRDSSSTMRRIGVNDTLGRLKLKVKVAPNVASTARISADSAEAIALARHVAGLPNLRLRGIMGIPAPAADPAQLRREFRALRACYDACDDAGLRVDTLSMGMSADLELAIAEGSTEVRIGTAIFGERQARR